MSQKNLNKKGSGGHDHDAIPKKSQSRHSSRSRDRQRRESKGTQSSERNNAGGNGGAQTQKDVYFIIPRTVTVLYGPYMWQGMMDYRTERLQGLKTFLEKLGVTVELTPCLDHVNACRIWFLDELIFSCHMTDLMYGGDGELDPLCWEAADNLEEFIKKVLKGLRTMKPMTPEELKKPYCPCFQIQHTNMHKSKKRLSSLGGLSRKSGNSSERRSVASTGNETVEKRSSRSKN